MSSVSVENLNVPERSEVSSTRQNVWNGIATALDKFLDIYGEVHGIRDSNLEQIPPARPEAFVGPGFALTFPLEGKKAIFFIAEQGGILPVWYLNPGIAGVSRLQFLARELANVYALPVPFEEKEVPPLDDFYRSNAFFAGRIATLEALFEELPWSGETEFRAFKIQRMDGRVGDAWVFGPLDNVSALRRHVGNESDSPFQNSANLIPVRPLEDVEVTQIPPEIHSPQESALKSEPETASEPTSEPKPEPESAPEPVRERPPLDSSWFPRVTAFRTPSPRALSRQVRSQRQERILSQIFYAHPANTQSWRIVTDSTVAKLREELESLQDVEVAQSAETAQGTELLPEAEQEIVAEITGLTEVPWAENLALPAHFFQPEDLLEDCTFFHEQTTEDLPTVPEAPVLPEVPTLPEVKIEPESVTEVPVVAVEGSPNVERTDVGDGLDLNVLGIDRTEQNVALVARSQDRDAHGVAFRFSVTEIKRTCGQTGGCDGGRRRNQKFTARNPREFRFGCRDLLGC